MKQEPLTLTEAALPTPLGALLVLVDPHHVIRAIDWETHEARLIRLLNLHYGRHGFTRQRNTLPPFISRAITDYFDGHLNALAPLRTATGGTPFQKAVWHALRAIPPGLTTCYGQLAKTIGKPNAARAVGTANGANPISIVIPCHRVIGANQTLTGYAGGLERKQWLLAHEQTHLERQVPESSNTTA